MRTTEPLEPLLDALRALVQWLDAAHVSGIVIGGVAASVLGRPRATRDVDILASIPDDAWASFLDRGRQYGFEPRNTDTLVFAREARVMLVRHASTGIDADIVLAGLAFEEEAIQRAVTVRLGGITIPLVAPEDLVIMKAVARRPRDIADIECVLSAQPGLDYDRVRRWVGEFAQALSMPDMLQDLDKLRERVRKE